MEVICHVPLTVPEQFLWLSKHALSCWGTHCLWGHASPMRVCLVLKGVWGRWLLLSGLHMNAAKLCTVAEVIQVMHFNSQGC